MGFWEVIAIMVVVNAVARVAKTRARAGQDAVGAGELDELHRRLDEHADSLADAQSQISDQNVQMEELHERLEFAERLLSKVRERPELGAGPENPQ